MQTLDGCYWAKTPKSSKKHDVQLSTEADLNIPCCECIDWKCHALPCKHLPAVLLHGKQCSGWDGLPQFYQNVPQFNLTFCKVHPNIPRPQLTLRLIWTLTLYKIIWTLNWHSSPQSWVPCFKNTVLNMGNWVRHEPSILTACIRRSNKLWSRTQKL